MTSDASELESEPESAEELDGTVEPEQKEATPSAEAKDTAEPSPKAEAPPKADASDEHGAGDDLEEAEEPYRDWAFFDNPSMGRAIRYTFAEKRLARAVFVNALLLVVMMALIQEAFGRVQLGLFHENISYGRLAFLGIAFVETVVVSLLAPLGFMYVFETERREECFDQVVTTGVSPHRIIFGRYFATLAFVGVVLFSSLPFFATTVVLDGASALDVVHVMSLLAIYGAALSAITAGVAVGFDDTGLPLIIAILAVALVLVCTLSTRGPTVFAAWSPIRHVILEFNEIAQGMRLGNFRPPQPFGVEVATSLVSLVYYLLFTFLGLGYAYVGPDIELTQGLDSFDSVSTSLKTEATQARRGVARTLLRTVQLRFFYENLSLRAQAISPLIRAAATVVIFAGGHLIFLGALWPDAQPKIFGSLTGRLAFPYLAFAAVTLCLLAVSGGGARAALMARSPVALGPLKIGRFVALFLIFGLALLVPPLLWIGAADLTGFGVAFMTPDQMVSLYGLVAGYAVFVFSISLLMAMLSTNPYSATGWTLVMLFAANLTPAIWIPLFTGNVIGEGSGFLLDLSPFVAAYAIARPGEAFNFSRFENDELVRYAHEPAWGPFVFFIAVVGGACLIAGITLALRARKAERERLITVATS